MGNHGAATYGSWSPLGHRSANGRLQLQFKNLELAQCMATANAVCAAPGFNGLPYAKLSVAERYW